MQYKVSPDVFFLVENGSVLLWHASHHEQFLLEDDYFAVIKQVSAGDFSSVDNPIFKALFEAGVVIFADEDHSAVWKGDVLARLFHVGTKNPPSAAISDNPQTYADQYIEECKQLEEYIPIFFQNKPGKTIELPRPNLSNLDSSLWDTLKARRTSRTFNGRATSLEDLSTMLYATFGLIHGEGWTELAAKGLSVIGLRKSSPASGGLHSEEAYITVYNVEGLEPGLYYYRVQDHKLTQLSVGNFEGKVIQLNKKQFYSKGLAFGIYLTSRLEKYWWKYTHSRTYRVMLLDLGHVSQTALLVATGLGMDTWITGVFDDEKVESFLGIDGLKESAILYIGCGFGDNIAFPENFYR